MSFLSLSEIWIAARPRDLREAFDFARFDFPSTAELVANQFLRDEPLPDAAGSNTENVRSLLDREPC